MRVFVFQQKTMKEKDKCEYKGDNLHNNRDILARGYKTFFMLNSTEHEISTAHKN